MKLTLNAQNKSELFDIQKSLIRTIALAAAAIIFISGATMQYFNPTGTMGFRHRLFFVFLFALAAAIADRKKSSYQFVELSLALAGSAFLSRILFLFYETNLSPNQIVIASLTIVGLSGVFIHKSSLLIVNFPPLLFIFYTMAYLPKEQHTPLSLALICLVAAATVGYFMTWQKVFLINKSLAQEAHKNIVINNLQEGVILADHNGKTLTLNQAICQIIGLTREEITTRNPLSPDWNMLMADGITPLPPDLLPTTVAKRTGKTVKNFPIVVKKSDHSIAYLEVTANPISSTHQPDTIEYILITCRDVSELKNAQDIIENQKMQTLANSKLTALGEMAAGIAHEINNPLTIILGRVGTIKRALANQTLDIADIHQGINKIESTTLRISKIVKSMRSLSRENLGGEFTRTGLKSIIDDIITISADNFKHHEITFFTDIQDNIELDCNAGLLSQVFINLINNAVDAIKKQTTSKWIRLEAVYNGNFIKIIFSDSGLGIAPTIKDKIMLPFFTTKEAGKGTGIGLSLSRTIVENHHGRFYIDDKATNTSFIIELPIDQAKNIVVNSAS